ncbi:MAG: ribosome biogenesis GTP-binding protein YihA/YsxC [Eubacteriales bacterium]|nr:ribosome biogenesis GTP-binding protein YihA/YsxC [Eubacteriales bacterium]
MKIYQSDLAAVAVKPQQYPPDDLPEIAFAGRSNVGKSTLLNYLTGRKNLARVSSAPGKTRTINFYEIDGKFRIVDLPGYGYAKISQKESEKWGAMMDTFFRTRKNLKTVVQLVDIRHEPSRQDVQMYEYLKYYNLDGPVIATKADKISKAQTARNIAGIRKALGVRSEQAVIPVSALKREGRERVLDALDGILEG